MAALEIYCPEDVANIKEFKARCLETLEEDLLGEAGFSELVARRNKNFTYELRQEYFKEKGFRLLSEDENIIIKNAFRDTWCDTKMHHYDREVPPPEICRLIKDLKKSKIFYSLTIRAPRNTTMYDDPVLVGETYDEDQYLLARWAEAELMSWSKMARIAKKNLVARSFNRELGNIIAAGAVGTITLGIIGAVIGSVTFQITDYNVIIELSGALPIIFLASYISFFMGLFPFKWYKGFDDCPVK